MKPKSILLSPPKSLSSCVAAGIFRDTRGADLSDTDRFNCFPTTPLVSATCIVAGELRLVDVVGDINGARSTPPMPGLSVMPPQDRPTVSWSPSDVCAFTVGFFPDAWRKLGGNPIEGALPEALGPLLSALGADRDPQVSWNSFCNTLVPVWNAKRHEGGIPDWPGSDRLSDWSGHLFQRIGRSAPGRSARTLERRLKQWTGKTRQHLDHFVAIEDLHRRTVEQPDAPLAELASEAGFSDQSHMGRAVRRSTGFSPARINRLIQSEEAFWCYRLLGERF
ncbi:MAG: helix-turn-helix domain-containing protein [Alphaproteobacteria bacterium]|nr:helix-turn-helix domain-containing protein [Alphaproteobacteria bacterium]